MARKKKKRAAPRTTPGKAVGAAAQAARASVGAVPAPVEDPRGTTVSRVGWAIFGVGLFIVAVERASLIGGLGAAIALVGTLTVVVGRVVRDREARTTGAAVAKSPWSYPLGLGLLAAGWVALLYPLFVTREAFRVLVDEYPYGPLVAVALGASGMAFLIDRLDRGAPAEPDFALPDPPDLASKLLLLNPLQLLAIPFAFFTKRPRRWVPFLFWLYDSWREIDREAIREREARASRGYDWRPVAVFCSGAVFLSLMEYFGHAPTFAQILDHYDPVDRIGPPETLFAIIRESPFRRLLDFVWWSGWRLLGFFLLPSLVLIALRERVTDHGLQTRGFFSHAWIYVLFFGLVLLAVIGVSYEESFQTYYPFYADASRSWYDFWTWEALYAVQFFSLEFFFRGFWIKSGKSMMGSHVIYAMVVPYCMIHFGKPFLETLGAIIAGLVLGTLALRTRSIWAGFLIHVSVAISMDLAALAQTTGLPNRWWPDL